MEGFFILKALIYFNKLVLRYLNGMLLTIALLKKLLIRTIVLGNSPRKISLIRLLGPGIIFQRSGNTRRTYFCEWKKLEPVSFTPSGSEKLAQCNQRHWRCSRREKVEVCGTRWVAYGFFVFGLLILPRGLLWPRARGLAYAALNPTILFVLI